MTDQTTYPRGRALALVAYILDMAADNGHDRDVVDALTDEVCEDPGERVRLISATAASQNREVPLQILELLGRRMSRQREALDREIDRDEVYGKWGQRIAASGILASVGFVAGGILTGLWGIAVMAGAVLAGAAVTKARGDLKRRARKARRMCEETERLIDLVKGAAASP